MKRICLNPSCSHYKTSLKIVCKGSYSRTSDYKRIPRWRCTSCKKNFSTATSCSTRWQKKRKINPFVKKLLCSNISMRRCAMVLEINRKTVARKLHFLANQARLSQTKYLRQFHLKKVNLVQFDDLETLEHSKCKPISVTMAVEKKTRIILGFELSQMPAKGRLAAIAYKKYGPRRDERPRAWNSLFLRLKDIVSEEAVFWSDESPHYPRYLRRHFPRAEHKTVKGARGSVGGQGELKKIAYDPLFSLNHTFAMLRANICRLIRRTWCTTKKIEALSDHLAIYVDFHNSVLLETKSR